MKSSKHVQVRLLQYGTGSHSQNNNQNHRNIKFEHYPTV